MLTADKIALGALGAFVLIGTVQTILLNWYARETRRLRQEAGTQNGTLSSQLVTMQASLQQVISKEEREADLHMFWGEGGISDKHRYVAGANFGGPVQLIETRCSRADVAFGVPSKIWPTNTAIKWLFNFDPNVRVYFSIKYLTKQKQVKEQVFELGPRSIVPFEVTHVPSNTLQLVQSYV